jgi:hypothetical protein
MCKKQTWKRGAHHSKGGHRYSQTNGPENGRYLFILADAASERREREREREREGEGRERGAQWSSLLKS